MENFQTSQSTQKLDNALVKAKSFFKSAFKDSTNPHFKSKYADLDSVWGACNEGLIKAAVTVNQFPIATEDNRVSVLTRVAHDGEFIQFVFSLPAEKQTPQGFGSALTYAKRYALSSALGISADEDDDGNRAEEELKAKHNASGPVRAQLIKSASVPAIKPAETAKIENSAALTTKVSDTSRADKINELLKFSPSWGKADVKDYITSRHGVSKLVELNEQAFLELIETIKNWKPEEVLNKADSFQNFKG